MLCRIAFHLSGRVGALHLDNNTTKVYLCNQSGTVSLSLSRLVHHILNLADKHGITLNSSICSYPSQCGIQLPTVSKVGLSVASSS